LDATYLKGRVDHQVVSRAVVVATGVTMDGRREVLGCAVGDSEDGAFWTSLLRSLLVISDQHLGLNAAVEAVMIASGCGGIGHLQLRRSDGVPVFGHKIVELLRPTGRGHHTVAAVECSAGELASESP
jgi:hypothetical protein